MQRKEEQFQKQLNELKVKNEKTKNEMKKEENKQVTK
jgi:hypothetical protein